MTQTPTPILTAIDIGQAERATRALLDGLLQEADITFEQWVVLRMLGTGNAPATRDELVAQGAALLRVAPGTVDDVVERMQASGLVSSAAPRETADVSLEPDGRARFDLVQAGVTRAAGEVYRDFDPEDLAIVHRVLVEVAARADALRSSS
ncbi:MAG: hypothetical protein QOI55_1219 [Actinomycetota bacterium]|nr:hypothetical protein [Actinomycetota bacterium]